MNPEEKVITALNALRERDRDCEAPVEVEVRLIQAFRRRKTLRRAVLWTGVAAALTAGLFLSRPLLRDPAAPARPPAMAAPAESVPVAATSAPRTPKARPRSDRPPRSPRSNDIVTAFFPLMDAPPPMERGAIFRVTVPAAAMRRVGLPVREERLGDSVDADILIGEEGMARAIRFVQVSQ